MTIAVAETTWKEATGGLDDTQLRTLADRLACQLEARRAGILGSIRDQGKLTPELELDSPAARRRAASPGSCPSARSVRERSRLAKMQREAARQPDQEPAVRSGWAGLWSLPATVF